MDIVTYALSKKVSKDIAEGAGAIQGKSAYEIAKANGFIGSEKEWLDSLKGKDGTPGITGPQGPKGEDGATYDDTEIKAEQSRLSESITEISDVVLAKSEPSPNLWNPLTTVRGSIDLSTGVVTEDGSGTYAISDFIEVNEGDTIRLYNAEANSNTLLTTYNSEYRIFFFDAEKHFVANGGFANGNAVVIPRGKKYVRIRLAWSYYSNGRKYEASLTEQVKFEPYKEKTKTVSAVLSVNNIKPNEKGELTLNIDSVGTKTYKKGNLIKHAEVEQGYIQADGTVKPYSTYWCTGFCEVEQGTLYALNIIHNYYFAFYDADKNVISTWNDGNMEWLTTHITKIAVPTNAKYFRGSLRNDPNTVPCFVSNSAEYPMYYHDLKCVNDVYPYTLMPSNPCDYQQLTVGVFNKFACIGDSITYGGFNMSNGASYEDTTSSQEQSDKYSYPSQFKKITGCDVLNLGTSGVTAKEWYDNHVGYDYTDCDGAVIHLGINDGAYSVSDEETTTALRNIIDGLKTSVKNIKIFLCTIVPAYANSEHSNYLAKSTLIRQFYNQNYADDSNVILIDLERYGHTKAYTSYTAGHLSALGYYQMAKDIAGYISWHIDNNLRDYRFIQFIGNNGEYTSD